MKAASVVIWLELMAIAAVAILVTGCASSGGIAPQAKLADGNALQAKQSLSSAAVTDAAWPRLDWWKSYGDPQLDGLVAEALEGSPSMRLVEARVRKALAQADVAQANRSPQVDGSGSATWQRYPEHGLYPPSLAGTTKASADLTARLSWDLDFFGRNRAIAEAALDEARASALDRDFARLFLSTSVVRAYVELEHLYAQLDVARAQLAQREKLVQLTSDRKAAGLDSLVEVRQAEAGLPEVRERILQLQESATTTRYRIAALLGQGPDRGLAIQRPQLHPAAGAILPTTVPADLVARRPDVQGLRVRVEAADRSIAAAKAEFYPNVNLTAFVGLSAIGLPQLLQAGSLAAGVGPAVHLPIFDAGRLRANLKGKDADYDMAVEAYNQQLSVALREVADQLAAFQSIGAQRGELDTGLRVATDAYNLALLRYREGLGNYLQVLYAESQVLNQRTLQADLAARELTASVDLTRALGGGYGS